MAAAARATAEAAEARVDFRVEFASAIRNLCRRHRSGGDGSVAAATATATTTTTAATAAACRRRRLPLLPPDRGTNALGARRLDSDARTKGLIVGNLDNLPVRLPVCAPPRAPCRARLCAGVFVCAQSSRYAEPVACLVLWFSLRASNSPLARYASNSGRRRTGRRAPLFANQLDAAALPSRQPSVHTPPDAQRIALASDILLPWPRLSGLPLDPLLNQPHEGQPLADHADELIIFSPGPIVEMSPSRLN